MPANNADLLLTCGPVSTTANVKSAMLRDWCTWDEEFRHQILAGVRVALLEIVGNPVGFTTVLQPGGGVCAVEATVASVVPESGRLLVLKNGSDGQRMVSMACRLGVDHRVLDSGSCRPPDLELLERSLGADSKLTHVAVVHCESATGMLNPVAEVGRLVHQAGRSLIVDTSFSLGGIPIDTEALGADFLIGGSSRCLQSAPGCGIVIAREVALAACGAGARSLNLDLYGQWRCLEAGEERWRLNSAGQPLAALATALQELQAEGGVARRHQRYVDCQRLLVTGMCRLGFEPVLPDRWQSPFITAFHNPRHPGYKFARFDTGLRKMGFVIERGQFEESGSFRVGSTGDIQTGDIERLLAAVAQCMDWV